MEQFTALVQELENLPANINPYEFLSHTLKTSIFPDEPRSTIDQLYFIAAVLALIALFAAISLAIRMWKRCCWAFRYDSRNRLIQPHGSVSWTAAALVAVALLEALVFCDIRVYQGRPHLDTGYIIFSAWSPTWIAGSIAIWSIGASLVLHLSVTGHDVSKLAWVSNIGGIGTPIAVLAAALPLSIIGGNYYKEVLLDYRSIQHSIANQAQLWSPGQRFDVATLLPDLPTLQSLANNTEKLAKFARWTYVFYSAATGVLLFAILSIGGFFLVSLQKVVRRSNGLLNDSNAGGGQKRVKRSLTSLVLILIAFTLLAAGCFGVSIYGAIYPLRLGRSSVSTALTLAPLYLFAFIGLPCTVLLIRGAYFAEAVEKGGVSTISLQSNRKGSGSATKGATMVGEGTGSAMVTVTVDVHVDEDVEGKEKFASDRSSISL